MMGMRISIALEGSEEFPPAARRPGLLSGQLGPEKPQSRVKRPKDVALTGLNGNVSLPQSVHDFRNASCLVHLEDDQG
mgnify:CR=1 FL=1